MVKLPKLHCKRCGIDWIPRKENPKRCPNCYSRLWMKPRKKVKGSSVEKE